MNAVEPKKLPPRHAAEFLQLVNDAPKKDRAELLKKHCSAIPFDMILSLNFNDRIKLDLPEGDPPFRRDDKTHPDMMSPTRSQIVRLKACLVGNQIPRFKKENVFIQVIESIPLCDAEVLILCKDKLLTKRYPNITKELVASVFPQWV